MWRLFLRFPNFILKCLKGNQFNFLFMKEKTRMNSSLEKCENVSSLSTLLPISKNRNSGAINSNSVKTSFNSKTLNGLPLLISAENTTFASTTSNILNHFLRSLLAIDKLTSSANSSTCSFMAFDLDTIESISLNSSNFVLINLENSNYSILPRSC